MEDAVETIIGVTTFTKGLECYHWTGSSTNTNVATFTIHKNICCQCHQNKCHGWTLGLRNIICESEDWLITTV